uniref:Uncharacterized protein n=1 Tax=Timema douglasi TaxID=61478 RepID=A0A7R8VMX0_TIMDO|nr:unnamed protein product [Timema douglasi]
MDKVSPQVDDDNSDKYDTTHEQPSDGSVDGSGARQLQPSITHLSPSGLDHMSEGLIMPSEDVVLLYSLAGVKVPYRSSAVHTTGRNIIRDCIQEIPSVHVTQYVINCACNGICKFILSANVSIHSSTTCSSVASLPQSQIPVSVSHLTKKAALYGPCPVIKCTKPGEGFRDSSMASAPEFQPTPSVDDRGPCLSFSTFELFRHLPNVGIPNQRARYILIPVGFEFFRERIKNRQDDIQNIGKIPVIGWVEPRLVSRKNCVVLDCCLASQLLRTNTDVPPPRPAVLSLRYISYPQNLIIFCSDRIRPADKVLKNPRPRKRPAPSRSNLVVSLRGSTVNCRLVQPILAGEVEGFRSWGLKDPPVRKEIVQVKCQQAFRRGRSQWGHSKSQSRACLWQKPTQVTLGGQNGPLHSQEDERDLPNYRGDERDINLTSANKAGMTPKITKKVSATFSQKGEASGAPPTTRGERATSVCQRESLALLRVSDDPALSKSNTSTSVILQLLGRWAQIAKLNIASSVLGLVPNGCKSSAAMPTWVSPVGSLQLPEMCLPLIAKNNWRTFLGLTAPRLERMVKAPASMIDSEDWVIRFSRVNSSCESVGVEGLSSGPDLSLIRDESSQGSNDECEGYESEANGGPGQAAPALDKDEKWWKSKGNNASHASHQPDTSGSGLAHKAKGKIYPIILCDLEDYSKVARVIQSKVREPVEVEIQWLLNFIVSLAPGEYTARLPLLGMVGLSYVQVLGGGRDCEDLEGSRREDGWSKRRPDSLGARCGTEGDRDSSSNTKSADQSFASVLSGNLRGVTMATWSWSKSCTWFLMAAHPNRGQPVLKELTVTLWNASGIARKKAELERTHLRYAMKFSLADFICHRSSRMGDVGRDGMVILVQRGLDHNVILTHPLHIMKATTIQLARSGEKLTKGGALQILRNLVHKANWSCKVHVVREMVQEYWKCLGGKIESLCKQDKSLWHMTRNLMWVSAPTLPLVGRNGVANSNQEKANAISDHL